MSDLTALQTLVAGPEQAQEMADVLDGLDHPDLTDEEVPDAYELAVSIDTVDGLRTTRDELLEYVEACDADDD